MYERGKREPVVAPGGLGLLEVQDVRVRDRLAHPRGEGSAGKLSDRPPQAPEARRPGARRLDIDELDRQVGGDVARNREAPPRRHGVELDAVLAEPSQQADGRLPGCAALRQRRLRQDEQRAQTGSGFFTSGRQVPMRG